MTEAPATPLLTTRFDDALAYASQHHRARTRKGNNIRKRCLQAT